MSMLALALTVVLAVATAAFYIAGVYGGGSPWARDVCSLSRDLCHNPVWLAFATAGLAVVYLLLRTLGSRTCRGSPRPTSVASSPASHRRPDRARAAPTA